MTILSSVVTSSAFRLTKSMGWHMLRREYFFLTFPITLSTCIRTFAIRRVCSTSIPLSCFFPLVNAGKVTVAQYRPTLSLISNPRSASTVSPGRSLFNSPQFSVKCLSLTLPPHPFDIKLTIPCGVIPIKYLAVLLCLYDEYVCALARRAEGISIKISKQSSLLY